MLGCFKLIHLSSLVLADDLQGSPDCHKPSCQHITAGLFPLAEPIGTTMKNSLKAWRRHKWPASRAAVPTWERRECLACPPGKGQDTPAAPLDDGSQSSQGPGGEVQGEACSMQMLTGGQTSFGERHRQQDRAHSACTEDTARLKHGGLQHLRCASLAQAGVAVWPQPK